MTLSINNIHAKSPKGVEILKGLSVEFDEGKLYAVMGPNGSGKSTLASVLAGHSGFEVTKGTVTLSGKEVLNRVSSSEIDNLLVLSPEERARAGLFLAFQYPISIPGVTVGTLLKQSIRATSTGVDRGQQQTQTVTPLRIMDINARIDNALETLKIDRSFLNRYVNDNLSGGEKKKSEILQLLCLRPAVAILDETDSGLDVDALKVVSDGVLEARKQNPNMIIVVITHYQRILRYLIPDVVHILMGGQIIKTGGKELAEEVEKSGYAGIMNHVA